MGNGKFMLLGLKQRDTTMTLVEFQRCIVGWTHRMASPVVGLSSLNQSLRMT